MTSQTPERAALDRRVLDVIARGVDQTLDDAAFNSLALLLYRHQYTHNASYRAFCDALCDDPQRVEHWYDVPSVPTGAFKEARLAAFPPEADVAVFRTSGSTTQRRGALHLDTLAVYEASLLATFGPHILPEGGKLRFLVLSPSARAAPDSSLAHMWSTAVRALGTADSEFLVDASGWDPERVIEVLAQASDPVAVVGTAFAFVHLIDALEARGRRLHMPPGSRVMETGGFKGRSRELPRDELHAAIAAALDVPIERIVNQYGMCELGSQFYEPSLRTGTPTQTKFVPPWVRTRAVDVQTRRDVPAGELGVLVHYDLANTGSVIALETSDRGRIVPGGFEVVGRLEGAEARGCSIAADTLLEGNA